MSVNISIYSNTNASTKSVQISFEGEILANDPTTTDIDYFFRVATSARDLDGAALPVKLVKSLDSLALNGIKQSASNDANTYVDIKSMIVDYTYDYIYGHIADQWTSGVAEQKKMKF